MENTYLVYNDDKECIIIDPGCYDQSEREVLSSFIENNDLNPIRLINTHCHIDHVLGNKFVEEQFNLLPEYHIGEQQVLDSCVQVANMYGLQYSPSSKGERFLEHGQKIEFGNTFFEIRLVPGHSPASIVLINHEQQLVFAGDTLFRDSIGRTDLPGGNHELLLQSIRGQLYSLDDEYTVLPGHGGETTIGHEKANNPFCTQK